MDCPKEIGDCMQRTNETMTAGIVNIPLSKPAKLFFYIDSNAKQIIDVYESFRISYLIDKLNGGRLKIESKDEIESSKIKTVFRNFRQLRPKLNSSFRYLFWEIDNQEIMELEKVIALYKTMRLPLIVHKTMRGYHFISVKPITKDLWNYAITILRPTNESYPPITLRVLANKYDNELTTFRDIFTVVEDCHTDTTYLRNWIYQQNMNKIQENYILVYYSIGNRGEIEI